jgi:aminopeptidase N
VFYSLESRVGRDVLLRSLRQYYQQFKKRGAGFNEFMNSVAEVSGQNLTPFFDDWVRTTNWLNRLERGEAVERIGGAVATAEHP